MEQLEFVNSSKFVKKYECKLCDHYWSRKYDYTKHLLTAKHQKRSIGTKQEQKEIVNFVKNGYLCECNKIYNTKSGLWKHKQKCSYNKSGENAKHDSNLIDKDMFLSLLQQNNEFKDVILEQSKQIMELAKTNNSSITNNNNCNNTTNNQFNLNVFLNEECKDAMNIMDFIGSLKVQFSDLENTGKVGYVKGVSDIFLKNLKELDVHKRPIHCSDLKREVMYVKDKDVWEKDEDKKKTTLAIRHIADKNFKQIHQWLIENPEAKDARNKKNEQYMKIVNKCTGGIDEEEDEKYYGKIITNVAKEVFIRK